MSWDLFNPFVAWLGSTSFALWMGTSLTRVAWLFIFHLFGLILLLGGVVVLSLRLFGMMQRAVPIAVLARPVYPAMMFGAALMIISGSFIFIGGAEAYFAGSWFRLKMLLLLFAVLFSFTIFRSVVYADEGRFNQTVNVAVGAVALLLWFGVGWAGRAIAFF